MTAVRAAPEMSTRPTARGLRQRIDTWQIRYPVAGTLRLHEVLAWVVACSVCATLIAPLAVGRDIRSFGLPTGYMRVWVILCTGFAVRWVYLQWRDRPSLPRHRRLPWGWCSAVSSLVVASIFVPSIVAGRTAEGRIRALRDAAALREDMARLATFAPGDRGLSSAAAAFYFSTWERSLPREDGGDGSRNSSARDVPWETLKVYAADTLVEELRSCSESFFTSDQYTEARAGCGESLGAEQASGMKDGYRLGACFDSFQEACQWRKIAESLGETFVWLAIVHHRLNAPPPSESPALLLQLAYLSLILGCVASYAAVTSARTVFGWAMPLTLIGTSIPDLVQPRVSPYYSGKWFGLPDMCGGAVYVIILSCWLLLMRKNRVRSPRNDVAAVLLQLWPLFVIVFRLRLVVLNDRWLHTPIGLSGTVVHLPGPLSYPCAVGALIALSGLLLSRYRTLPWST